MVVTFCGHSDFRGTKEYEEKILAILEEKIGDEKADIYLGGYGGFDEFAYSVCKKYKETHTNTKLIFVTPYMTLEYQKNHLEGLKNKYDLILYPEIENKPLKFAITYRNKYMVENADFVIAYIDHSYGGAYQTYTYAKRKNKVTINLAEI